MTVATINTINANVWFKLADAPLVIERFAGLTTFTPTLGWWSTEWSAEYGETPVHVTLSCADSVIAALEGRLDPDVVINKEVLRGNA